ncbi:hypothetical protein G210_0524 [Candida maltosa Xu316]|uniref:Uncharacterized protein n=1 Tax=Candida maltosa (strain Xu316) TaxID=1245528 RepID=M3K0L2_CANMX|nr:hypothetical protein G210_0524 [Candida maltosa Xu316]
MFFHLHASSPNSIFKFQLIRGSNASEIRVNAHKTNEHRTESHVVKGCSICETGEGFFHWVYKPDAEDDGNETVATSGDEKSSI